MRQVKRVRRSHAGCRTSVTRGPMRGPSCEEWPPRRPQQSSSPARAAMRTAWTSPGAARAPSRRASSSSTSTPSVGIDEGTRYQQPALFLCSVAAWEARDGEPPVAGAGHSLGEYAALVAAGALRFEDGLRLVDVRAAAMATASTATPERDDRDAPRRRRRRRPARRGVRRPRRQRQRARPGRRRRHEGGAGRGRAPRRRDRRAPPRARRLRRVPHAAHGARRRRAGRRDRGRRGRRARPSP